MTRRVLCLEITLGVLSGVLVAALIEQLFTARPLPAPPRPRAVRPAAALATAPAVPVEAGSPEVIGARNLFSSTRTEAASGPVAGRGPRPVLHGVVVDGTRSRAFVEDAQLRRAFGYAVGDALGGGRLQSIGPDRIVIAGVDGRLEVPLRDPTRPKPTPPSAPAASVPPPAALSSSPGGEPAAAALSETSPTTASPSRDPDPALRLAPQ